MDFKAFSKKFADRIGGEYNEYDENRSIFIVPLAESRFQTVTAQVLHLDQYDRKAVKVSSKVCAVSPVINFPEVLEASKDFIFTNFIVEDGFLKVDTTIFLDNSSEQLLEEIIKEVAYKADEWELKITGKDIH